MRQFFFLAVLSTILLSAGECKKKNDGAKYRGRLEVAGICMNYTIGVTEGDPGADKLVARWTDEVTKKEYTNVFRLGNPCQFPSTIKQGDEFYFTIDTTNQKDCAVCLAYYPTPEKALSIKVAE